MLGFCYAEILQVFHRTHPGVLLEQVGEIASVDSNVVRQLLHLHWHIEMSLQLNILAKCFVDVNIDILYY